MTLPDSVFRKIFELHRDAIIIIAEDGQIVDCNPAACQRRKMTRLQSQTRSIHNAWGATGDARFAEMLRKDEALTTFRTTFQFSPVDLVFSEVAIVRITNPEEFPRLYLVTVKDISEQRKIELDLLRFSEVTLHTVNPIQITDANGKIIYVNPAYERISGYRKDELIGRNPNLLKSGLHSREFWEKIWNRILSGKEWVGQLQNKRKDGTLFHSEVVISPILDENRIVIGFVGAHKDITEQKKLETQLVRSQKMETFGTLAAGIAHEVGNPLTSISSIVQVIQRTTKDDFAREKLELVKNQINRITKIIRELVDFSRPSAYEVKKTDINNVIRDALNIVQYGKKVQHITFNVKLLESLPHIAVVSDQLVQVFLNILMNAVDACDQGRHQIDVSSTLNDHTVEITVRDDGRGIAKEDIEKIFDPFFTTKEVGKGTGLGLWVSLGIVKSFGGDIQVQSEPNQGTTFIISLPMKGNLNE
ncbi:MAG: PAS domain S-box protein [Acidobacteriota bacterium]